MTTTLGRAVETPMSTVTKITAGLLVFLGLSASAGGFMMIIGSGTDSLLPAEWLDEIPVIDSWLVPGLVLGVGFGLGSLMTAYGVIRKPSWGRLEFNAIHTTWDTPTTIVASQDPVISGPIGHEELVFLPEWSSLQAIYGPLGLSLALLPWLPSVRSWLKVSAF